MVVELPGSVVVVVVVVVVVELELVLLVVVVVWHDSVVDVVDPVVDVPVVDDDRVVVVDPLVVVGWREVDARVVALAAAAPVVREEPGAAAGPLGAPAPTVTPPAYTRAQPRIAST
ncbi:MAG TPA: hypothetical protein VF880_15330 [Actinomycetes bacterium]